MDIVIGIDLARKGNHQAYALAGLANKIGGWSFRSNKTHMDKILADIREVCSGDDNFHIVMEATGFSWLTVAQYFKENGCQVYRIPAEKNQKFRKYLSKYTKNDEIDAECLARLWYVQPGYLDEIYLRDKNRFGLKRLIKQREEFVLDQNRYKSRIGSLLDGIIPEAGKLSNRLVQKKKFRPVLRKLLDLYWVKNMGLNRFRRYIKKRDGDISNEDIDKLFEACLDAYELHCEKYIDFEELSAEVNNYLDMIEFLEEKINKVTAKIEDKYEVVDSQKYLCNLYGMAELSAAYAEAIIGRVERFKNLNKVSGWLGWHPKTEDSGNISRKGLGLSKAGDSAFRRQLYMATNVARQYDPQIAKIYYEQMVEKGNPHTKAIIAAGTRLLDRIIRIMRDRRPYELRDTEGNAIDKKTARELCQDKWKVPQEVRDRLKQKKAS